MAELLDVMALTQHRYSCTKCHTPKVGPASRCFVCKPLPPGVPVPQKLMIKAMSQALVPSVVFPQPGEINPLSLRKYTCSICNKPKAIISSGQPLKHTLRPDRSNDVHHWSRLRQTHDAKTVIRAPTTTPRPRSRRFCPSHYPSGALPAPATSRPSLLPTPQFVTTRHDGLTSFFLPRFSAWHQRNSPQEENTPDSGPSGATVHLHQMRLCEDWVGCQMP